MEKNNSQFASFTVDRVIMIDGVVYEKKHKGLKFSLIAFPLAIILMMLALSLPETYTVLLGMFTLGICIAKVATKITKWLLY